MTAAFRRYLRTILRNLGLGGGKKRRPALKTKLARFRPAAEILEDRLAPALFNVATFGNDVTGDGSAANPYRTLQRAVNEAAAFADGNDTINLAGGTYNQAGVDLNVLIPNSANITNLSVLGGWNGTFTVRDPLATPTLFAPQTGALATPDVLILDANTTVDGLNFQFAAGGLEVQNANNVRVQNNSFLRVGPADALGAALLRGTASSQNVTDLVLLNNQIDAGAGILNSFGIVLAGSSGFQLVNANVTDNQVTNASLAGLAVSNTTTTSVLGGSFSGNRTGVELVNATSAALSNVSITGNTLRGLFVNNTVPGVDLALANLTLTGNGAGGQLQNVNGLNFVTSAGAAVDVLNIRPDSIQLSRDGSQQQQLDILGLNFLKVDLGDGNDEAIFETAFYAYAIVEVDAKGGTDTLTYNATAGSDVVVINGTNVTINGNNPPVQGPAVILLGFEEYSVNGLGDSDFFTVEATSAPVTLRGGDGDDFFDLGLAGSMDLLATNLTLDGGSGVNFLSFNDQGEATGNSYTAGSGVATRNGAFTTFNSNISNFTLNGGTGDDTFSVAPDANTTYTVVGNPPVLPAAPGDTLNLDLTGLTNPQNFITGPGDGIFNFGNAQPLGYLSIETLNVIGGQYDLVFNLNLSIFGNDFVADVIQASLDATGANLQLFRLGDPPFYTGLLFNGAVSAVRSLSVIGSSDDDTLLVVETAGGLLGQTGGFTGNAVGSHLNSSMEFVLNQLGQSTNVGLHFDGGLGGTNRLQYEMLTQRDAQFYADAVASPRSGNVNLNVTFGLGSQLRSSFANLAPIGFLGAGGILTVDNTGISGAGDLLTVADDATAGDGISQVTSSNPLFETTFFQGFGTLQVLGGTGSQTLEMNGLDSAATETLVMLFGTDTFGTDVGDDQFFIRQSAATVLTLAVGGGGNDTFNVGNALGVVDNILGDVELYGDGGTQDVVLYNDAGNAVGQTYTIESTRINRSGGVGEVRYSSMEELNVFTSSDSDIINILSTLATTPLFVQAGAGNDFINLSSDAPLNSGNLDGIAGTVNLDAGAGANTLSVSDLTGTTANSNAFIGFNQILGFAGPTDATVINYTATGGSFSAINIEGSVNVGDTFTVNNPNGPLNLNTYGGADTVNVQAISFVANVNTGVDADTINVSSDAPTNLGNLDAINATLNLEAGSGANVLNVSDFSSLTANNNVTIGNNFITGLAGPADAALITYLATGGTFSQIRVDGSNTSGDIVAVLNPNGPLTLNTHGGEDDVFLFATSFVTAVNGGADNDDFFLGQANLLDNLLGAINIDGGAGNNEASALDLAQVAGRSYTLIPGLFTRDGGIFVTFANLATFEVNAGTGNDTFDVATSTETLFVLNGNLPALPTLPGDTLNLDLSGAANATLNLGNPGDGQFTFSNRQTIFFTSIETLNALNGQYDLVVDLNAIPDWGNDGIADIIEVRLDAAGTNLVLDRLGLPPDFVGVFFNSTVAAIRSLAVIGSSDPDTLRIREVNGRLPGETGGLNGTAPGSHLNGPMQFFLNQQGAPSSIGIHFAGGPGASTDRLQFQFTTSRKAHFFADAVAAARSGNVNVSGTSGLPASSLRLSFNSLTPIDFFGAGGELVVDNTGISGVLDELTVQDDAVAGDGISQVVSSNALFETTNFAGFESVAVVGGTGDQTLIMNGLDSAATEIIVVLDGDDTFGTDVGTDALRVNQSAATVTTTLLGGAGNDLFIIGNAALVVDNILGDVFAYGETGNDLLLYRDDGNAVGQTYTITADRISRSGGVGDVFYVNQDIVEVRTSQAADQIDVQSTNAGTTTRVFAGAGNDTFNISSDAPANLGNLDGIAGLLGLNGEGDANVLNVSDFGGTTPNANVVIGFDSISGFAGPSDNIAIDYTATGGSFSAINIEGSNTVGETFTVVNPNGPLNLNTNGGADTVNVQATLFVATINTGAGDDVVNVSSDAPTNLGNLDGIGGTLNLDLGAGANLLQVSDFSSATANAFVIITATQMLNFAGVADNQIINYAATGGTFSSINIWGSNLSNDAFNVLSPNGPAAIYGNGGDDTFNIQSLTNQLEALGLAGNDLYNISSDAPTNLGDLDGINAPLILRENGGQNNRIRISDFTTATANSNVVVGFSQITGLAGAADGQTIEYLATGGAAFSELTINGSDNPATAEQYRVLSPNAPLTLNLNGGNDVARVQSLILAATVNGGAGDDQLIASSTGLANSGNLDGINAPLTLNGGTGNNVIDLVDFDGGPNLAINFTSSTVSGLAGLGNSQVITYSNAAGAGNSLVLNLQGSNTAIDNLNLFSTLAGSTKNFFLNGGDDGFVVLSSPASSPGSANLFGGAGNDEFAFANGAALNTGFIDGGTGVNLLNYVTWTTAVSVNLGTGLATGLLNNGVFEGNRIAPLTIQNIVGGLAGDLLLGDLQANRIEGRGGNNQIAGQGGDDILLGGAGNDVIMGGPGNDMIYGGGGRDALFGDYVRPGSPVPPIPGAINAGPGGRNVIVLFSCNDLRQGPRGARIIDVGGSPGARGRIVVARFRGGQLVGPIFVTVGPVTLGPLIPYIQTRYNG